MHGRVDSCWRLNIIIVKNLWVKNFLCLGAYLSCCCTNSWMVLCGRKHSRRGNEYERWHVMRNFSSFCLFKILMASTLLPWGRWPFLGHLPTALLLWNLCCNASKPAVYTLFSRSAECEQPRLIISLLTIRNTIDFLFITFFLSNVSFFTSSYPFLSLSLSPFSS